MLLAAVRELMSRSSSARAALPASDPQRQFFLGVDAAGMEILHPELASARPMDWPAGEPAPFREGYLRASLMLAEAAIGPPPLRLRLPLPPE